jgi:hypothetical protein
LSGKVKSSQKIAEKDEYMGKAVDQNNKGLKAGAHISGYVVRRTIVLKETHSFFYELEHSATGARHIHISNGDRENTFSVAFRTVPKDSTGVAHILEHTVLCGSAKFPVRVFLHAETKFEHLHECLYRVGLDHVPILHSKRQRLL